MKIEESGMSPLDLAEKLTMEKYSKLLSDPKTMDRCAEIQGRIIKYSPRISMIEMMAALNILMDHDG